MAVVSAGFSVASITMLSDRLKGSETLPTKFVSAPEALKVVGSVSYELESDLATYRSYDRNPGFSQLVHCSWSLGTAL